MRNLKFLLTLLFIGLFYLLNTYFSEGAFSSIKIDRYDAVVTLDEEGDMTVVERWDMNYRGDYNVRFRDIVYSKYADNYPLTRSASNVASFDDSSASIRVFMDDIEVTDDVRFGYSFNNDRDELGYVIACEPYSSSCESLFVDFTDIGGLTGNVTFEYTYTILGAVTQYTDISELNWRLFTYMEADIDEAHVIVNLPDNALSEDTIRVWGHGLSDGTINIINNHQIEMNIDQINKEEFLEFRILADNSLFDQIRGTNIFIHDTMNLASISAYEQELTDETNRRILYAQILNYGAYALIVIMIGIVYWVYRKYDKELTPDFDGDYFRELPSDETPGEVSYLYYEKKIPDEAFTATLLDLIRKKYVTLEYSPDELTDKNPNFTFVLDESKDQASLQEHERYLINWIFKSIARSNKVMISTIESYGKKSVNAAEQFQRSAKEFVRAIKRSGEKRKYFDQGVQGSKKQALAFLILPIAFLLMTFFISSAYVVEATFAYLSSISLIVLYALYVSTIKRKTQMGANLFARWKAFKKFLLDFSQMQDYPIPGIIVWEHFLVYATVLKCADQVMEQLKVKLPNVAYEDSEGTFMAMGYRHNGFYWGYMFGRMTRSVSTAKANAVQTIAKANAAKASSGFGGGFGGGSSFGGGGGGGRSR